ncbi:terminase small subunit [Anaeroselena agilis]|uniref:Terminase small subunit n=1 Tax=Anaeroselena agilis TaxID=3063788 RepID=A0ABU3NVS4_9FIRM|nr:terminase small subunit [Selenomonadales bacterium 4137-cl]
MPKDLTPKQEKFVEAYIEHGNATEAVIQAGYDVKDRTVAKAVGCENLTKPYLSREVERRKEELLEKMRYHAIDALNCLVDTINDDAAPRAVRVQASRDLLDRVGLGAEQNINITGSLSHHHIASVLDRARGVIAERQQGRE